VTLTLTNSETGEPERYHTFFIFWALKEAYIKAIGIGLGFDLTKVCFTLNITKSSTTNPRHIAGTATANVFGTDRQDWRYFNLSILISLISSVPDHLVDCSGSTSSVWIVGIWQPSREVPCLKLFHLTRTLPGVQVRRRFD
jgi:hypothetical protein